MNKDESTSSLFKVFYCDEAKIVFEYLEVIDIKNILLVSKDLRKNAQIINMIIPHKLLIRLRDGIDRKMPTLLQNFNSISKLVVQAISTDGWMKILLNNKIAKDNLYDLNISLGIISKKKLNLI